MALEPRFMFDGAAVATLATADQPTGDNGQHDAPVTDAAPAAAKEVAFVDSSVDHWQSLVDGIRDGIEIVVLDSSRDGLAQIAEWAQTHSGYDSVHIVSHGTAGSLSLGAASLNADTLDARTGDLSALGAALKSDGDILIYGCSVGAGESGARFVEKLAALTGADVAASDDATGGATANADWDLERQTGAIETGKLLTDIGESAFDGVLADTNLAGTMSLSGTGSADIFVLNAGSTLTGSNSYNDPNNDINGASSGAYYTITGFDVANDKISVVFWNKTTAQVGIAIEGTNAGYSDFYDRWANNSQFEIYAAPGYIAANGFSSFGIPIPANAAVLGTGDAGAGDTLGTIVFLGESENYWDLCTIFLPGITATNLTSANFLIEAPTNNNPTINVGDMAYTENAAAAAVDGTATANDADGDADWNGGKIEVQITANNVATDTVSIGTSGNFSISSGNLSYSGVGVVGTISETSGTANDGTVTNGDKLTVTFNASATNAIVQEFTRSVQYSSTSDNPTAGAATRTLTFTATDKNAGTASDTATVTITAVNDAPSFGAGQTLSAVNEDTASPSGATVNSLFNGTFSDPDGNSLGGIAISATAANASTEGTWQYTTDGGANWYSVGTPSTAAALLIQDNGANTKLRFVPVANYNGTPGSLTVYAVDNSSATTWTSGNTAQTFNTTTDDATSKVSTAGVSLGTSITAVNDAPVLDNTKSPVMTSIAEDLAAPSNGSTTNSFLVAGLIDNGGSLSNYTDVEGDSIGIAITAVNASGTLYYSTDGGTNWTAVGAVAANSARVLYADANTRVYFKPNADVNGTLSDAFTFKAWDRTGGYANGQATVDTTSGTAFSSATDTVSLTATAVNDDPTATGLPTDVTVTEDTLSNLDLSALTFADVDSASNAISLVLTAGAGTLTASSGGNVTVSGSGSGQLTLSGTASDIDTFLNTASNVKYTGAANAAGDNVTTLTLTANDGGAVGTGGGTNVTLGTVNIDITAVNDAPTASGTYTFTSTDEDTTSTGVTVATIVAGLTAADVDGDTLGIAVTGTTGNGTWQFSHDSTNGTDGTWTAFNVSQTPSAANSLLLTNAAYVRYVPDQQNGETATITVRGWDQTAGTASSGTTARYADTATNGNATAYSTGTATGSLTVTAVNDAPSAVSDANNSSGTGSGNYTGSFSAGGSAVSVVDTDFTITDVDNSNMASATIVLTGHADAGESLTISGTPSTSNGITITYTSATQISLSGSATKAAYETVIKSILYQNTNAAGSTTTGNRTVTVTVNDGTADDSTPPTSTISVVTAPIIDLDGTAAGTGKSAAFTENGGAVSIVAADATLTDSDSANLNQLVIQITNAKTGDVLKLGARSNGDIVNGITITEDSSSQITLSGSATKADYLALIKEATFNNSSEAPDTTDRAITFTGRDTSGNTGSAAAATVSVTAINDAPAFAGLDATPNPNEKVATVLDANATLSDAELDAADNYNGATLTLVRNGGASANDSFANTGTLGALTQGGNLVVGGTTIGTVTTNSAGTLLLTFNASATAALVDSALQQITYTNSSDTESGAVTINYTFSDGTTVAQGSGGAKTATGSVTVTVAAVNDAPTFSDLDGTPRFVKGGNAVTLDANALLADAELDSSNNYNGASLTIARNGGANANDSFANTGTLGTLTEGGNLVVGSTTIGTVTTNSAGTLVLTFNANATSALVDSALQQITYSAANAQAAANVQLDYSFSDGTTVAQGSGGAKTASGSITVTVADNSAPQASGTDLSPPSGQVGTGYSFALPTGTFTDADTGDTLTYTATGLPAGLTINASTGAISGTPGSAGTATVTITVTDSNGATATKTFSITVNAAPAPAAPAPAPAPALPPQPPAPPPIIDNGPVAPIVTVVRDPGAPQPTSIQITPPSAPQANVGPQNVGPAIQQGPAGDGAGAFRVSTLAASGAGQGDALVAVKPVAVVEMSGTQVAFTLPGDTFATTKADATVTLAATQVDGTALPGWLSFNPQTGTFVGQPPPGLNGEVVIRVIARDQDGREAIATVRINLGTGAGQQGQPQGAPADGPQDGAPDQTGWLDDGGETIAAEILPAKAVGRTAFSEQVRQAGQMSPMARQAVLAQAARQLARLSS
jgi:hypothetical protein